ncbi:hypothetical protein ACN2XU_03875 [Primorskyibacter sp. 2E107]|uniref:hypothetical protein n=1 Tax=Primorskyibacter sp. 2E107 TaxID=3403458 RepID=UPI003AF4C632
MSNIGLPGLFLITGGSFDSIMGYVATALLFVPFPMIDPQGAQTIASLIDG